MDTGCMKFHQSGLDENQRKEIATLISRYFHGNGFPAFEKMDLELANVLADALPALICEEVKSQNRQG